MTDNSVQMHNCSQNSTTLKNRTVPLDQKVAMEEFIMETKPDTTQEASSTTPACVLPDTDMAVRYVAWVTDS